MLTYWDLLTIITIIQLILAVILLTLIIRIANRPVGLRLAVLASIFIIQSLTALVIYRTWQSQGYGPEISKPLMVLQSSILLGMIILIDITKD